MHFRVLASSLVVSLATLFGSLASAQIAVPQSQVAFAPSAAAPAPALEATLDRGRSLEGERRWGEALTLYEDAMRQFPEDAGLERRFETTRLHYDIGRRYNDNSFRAAVQGMSTVDALALYDEVLLKIQSHYVEQPNWPQLVDRGALALDVALTDSSFVERNLPGIDQGQIDHFRRQLRVQPLSTGVSTRETARQAVAGVARQAKTSLGLTETAAILECVGGATNLLDPYSSYLTADQLNEVYSQIEGNFVGLGVELKANAGSLLIVKVITGSPAEKGGLVAGDRIVAVDGRNTTSMNTDQAANMLQGKEGTSVEVTAMQTGAQPRVIKIRREQVEVPSVDDVKMVDADQGVAYLKLTCFQKTTSRDLDAALWNLNRQGMKTLIMDLRGNPGGLLTTSVEVADKFLERGTVVSTRGRSAQEDFNYSAHAPGTWKVPLVVLIDGDSASASEIFAGAIRDHHRGKLVGARSYGKGSVQGIFPLSVGGAGLRLTTAKFYSPSGHPYAGVGVEPDLVVQQVAKPVNGDVTVAAGGADAALDAALQVARSSLASR